MVRPSAVPPSSPSPLRPFKRELDPETLAAATQTPPRPVKRELDAETLAAATQTPPRPPPRKRRRRGPLQANLSQPLLTPQIIPSGAPKADPSAAEPSGQPGLKATPAKASVKRRRCDASGKDASGKAVERGLPHHHGRPTPAEPPTLWTNRHRLGRLLHELAQAQLWRDAAGVLSTLLPGTRRPESFMEARSMFVVGMEIHRRLAEESGEQLGGRSSYYFRTQKIFDVWLRRLIWLPTCAKKYLVKLELALFYLSQGNIDNAYNATRTLIAKTGLQAEPTLNLIHGLISYDKWYSSLPKDMQLEEFDVYTESCAMSMASNGCEEIGLQDSSGDNCSMDVDGASFPACSSENSINNGHIDKKRKISVKPAVVHSIDGNDSIGSQLNEELVDTDFRSLFFNTSNNPTCGLEKSLLPLRLKCAAGTSTACFDSYWKYKSTPNTFYEDAQKCLRLALHSTPPIMAALLPLVQILLLGDKVKDALGELEKTCQSSTTALPFRLRGRLLEYFDQSQVSTISSCYEEALRRDPTCSYSVERLTKMHRKGYYNTTQLLETIALHLDSASGKSCIWEELVSCFLRLFSDGTTDYEDCISWNVQADTAIKAFSSFSSVFFEQHTRESWKVRCRWWMNHHFSQSTFTSEALKGDCKLLASKAACASHLFGPGFQYVKAVERYLSKQEATDEIGFLSRNKQNSVRLLRSLKKLA